MKNKVKKLWGRLDSRVQDGLIMTGVATAVIGGTLLGTALSNKKTTSIVPDRTYKLDRISVDNSKRDINQGDTIYHFIDTETGKEARVFGNPSELDFIDKWKFYTLDHERTWFENYLTDVTKADSTGIKETD